MPAPTYTTATMHTALRLHLDRHMYRRGRHKGDAPLDWSRRGRSHERVIARGPNMAVRMHATDIITACPDGRVIINTDGWHTSPTTRDAVNDALRWFSRTGAYIHSARVGGVSQTALTCADGTIPYKDGVTLDANGAIVRSLDADGQPIDIDRRFRVKRIDRDATAALAAGVKASGFAEVFRVLHAALHPDLKTAVNPAVRTARASHLREILTSTDHAELWPDIVAYYSSDVVWVPGASHQLIKLDRAKAWAKLMTDAKEDLYRIVKEA